MASLKDIVTFSPAAISTVELAGSCWLHRRLSSVVSWTGALDWKLFTRRTADHSASPWIEGIVSVFFFY